MIIPTYCSPHKQESVYSSKDRYDMLCKAQHILRDMIGAEVVISDYEISKKESSYTVSTLGALCNPEERNLFLLGEDAFLTFHTWKKYEEILSLVELVIGQRKGDLSESNIPQELKLFKNRFIFLDNECVHISSTAIRYRLKTDQPIDSFVPSYIPLM